MNADYILGIDIGSSSVGWAAIETAKNNEPNAILSLGVRIFNPGMKGLDGV